MVYMKYSKALPLLLVSLGAPLVGASCDFFGSHECAMYPDRCEFESLQLPLIEREKEQTLHIERSKPWPKHGQTYLQFEDPGIPNVALSSGAGPYELFEVRPDLTLPTGTERQCWPDQVQVRLYTIESDRLLRDLVARNQRSDYSQGTAIGQTTMRQPLFAAMTGLPQLQPPAGQSVALKSIFFTPSGSLELLWTFEQSAGTPSTRIDTVYLDPTPITSETYLQWAAMARSQSERYLAVRITCNGSDDQLSLGAAPQCGTTNLAPTVPSVTHRLVVHRDALQALLLTNLDKKSSNAPWVLASRTAVAAQWNTGPVIWPGWTDSSTPAGLTILDVLTQGDTTPRYLTWLSGQPPSASSWDAASKKLTSDTALENALRGLTGLTALRGADLDGDGLTDLVAAMGGQILFYYNRSTSQQVSFASVDPKISSTIGITDVAVAKIKDKPTVAAIVQSAPYPYLKVWQSTACSNWPQQ
jgi:hypothetical protein